MKPRKVYVLVRADLPPGAQLAQSGHAAIELALKHPDVVSCTPTIVMLQVRDEEHLLDFVRGASREGLPLATFVEPDMGYTTTAMAAVSDGRMFMGLQLAGEEDHLMRP